MSPHVRRLDNTVGQSYIFAIAEDVNVTFTLRVYTESPMWNSEC